mmetsp:Transcript_66651/g.126964  ORF Transcript_66651/g.126964 Transcript_66651/m.126964 type:complete len:425 (+) Transcript_66651:74-1348(+)
MYHRFFTIAIPSVMASFLVPFVVVLALCSPAAAAQVPNSITRRQSQARPQKSVTVDAATGDVVEGTAHGHMHEGNYLLRGMPRAGISEEAKLSALLSMGHEVHDEDPVQPTTNSYKDVQRCSQVRPEGPPNGTTCPDPVWVDEMVRADASPGKTIVNIGCNKGNDAIRWMELWDMSTEHFWSQAKWNELMPKEVASTFACAPQRQYVTASTLQPASKQSKKAVPTGICVEPMPNTIGLLNLTAKALGYNASTLHGSLHIVPAAVVGKASAGETRSFPNVNPGTENVKLQVLETDEMKCNPCDVPVKTVDSILQELAVEDADILLIDTEGYDAEVLKGAKRTLAKVRYLEFEVHRDIKPWSSVSLKSVVTDLDQQGFDCYWAGNNGKLTDIKNCWSDLFERGMWSNAVCARRGDVWSGVLQKFSV